MVFLMLHFLDADCGLFSFDIVNARLFCRSRLFLRGAVVHVAQSHALNNSVAPGRIWDFAFRISGLPFRVSWTTRVRWDLAFRIVCLLKSLTHSTRGVRSGGYTKVIHYAATENALTFLTHGLLLRFSSAAPDRQLTTLMHWIATLPSCACFLHIDQVALAVT